MTLRHLRIFLAVCETGSMTAAAKQLHMTQPPVSQAIVELERYYGIKLFERIGRKIYLTKAGEELYSYASHILSLSNEAEKRLSDLSKGGILRVGASKTIGSAILPFLIREFSAAHPTVQINAVIDNTATIINMLYVAKLDIGLVEGIGNWPDIVKIPVYEDELVLVCPPMHEWAKAGSIDTAQLEDQSFIVREEGSGTREVFEAAMKSHGIKWKAVGVFNSVEAIINAVHCGFGLSFMSRLAVQNAVATGKVSVVKVVGLNIKRKFNLVYHKNKFFNTAINEFKTYCFRFCKQT
ncbi:DNA-binding transcriptional regulator, LysR family [Carboxydocella thermautotrophica]|nr:DNA-binding transcriptional regulator, LysR family [Carboxydocella thermautotrophica]